MPPRIAGVPTVYWALGLIGGVIGFAWVRSRSQSTGASSAKGGGAQQQPTFSQAQEVQDFQIFSALTSQTQASDLNFLGEVASLFAGGSSPSTGSSGGGGGTTTPSPTNTGTVPPAVQSAYNQDLYGALTGPGTAPQDAALSQAIQNTPTAQRGNLENFFLLNQANQQAGYDYYTSTGLQTTPLGVAPGE